MIDQYIVFQILYFLIYGDKFIRIADGVSEQTDTVLRLWRSFLGWVLALLFCWEVPVRLLLLPLLAPDLLDDLPPPALDQILGLLAGMLGLPF